MNREQMRSLVFGVMATIYGNQRPSQSTNSNSREVPALFSTASSLELDRQFGLIAYLSEDTQSSNYHNYHSVQKRGPIAIENNRRDMGYVPRKMEM